MIKERKNIKKFTTSGQSLIEVLIAVAIGVIFIVGGLALIAPSLENARNVQEVQTATALGKELIDNVRVFAKSDWNNIDSLATTSASTYHISTSSPFTAISGSESVVVSSTTYTRYFYLDDVYRDSGDKINNDGNVFDPSTKKITVVYSYNTSSSSIVTYVGRSREEAVIETDWSGGAGIEGPIFATGTNEGFSTSTNIDFTTTTGSIIIQGI